MLKIVFLCLFEKLVFRYSEIESLLIRDSLALCSTFALFEPQAGRRLMPFPTCLAKVEKLEYAVVPSLCQNLDFIFLLSQCYGRSYSF